MISTLKKFGFGCSFIKWIQIIYSYRTASIITNQNISLPFSIKRVTRQGCPLSPFLFSIIIEPLAASVRQHPQKLPINISGQNNHLSLYADDVLLYISKPQISIPHLLSLIKDFGSFSGFTINWDKSELMPLSAEIDKTYLQSVPFKKAFDNFSYLGVTVTKNPSDLLCLNWQDKIQQVKHNIDFWKTLQISLAGKINAIKMVVLPRFLHLFQSLPCYITQPYFKQLDSILIPFIWNYKTVRISKKHLSKSKNSGGFMLPNFKMYYWAAHLSVLAWWKKGPPSSVDSCPAWLVIERLLCKKSSLSSLLNSPDVIKDSYFSNSFVIGNTVKIWKQIKIYIKAPKIYVDAPIWQNHSFIPGLDDAGFYTWSQKGICTVGDLYINGSFATFAQSRAKYNTPATHFFRYLQIRDYVRKHLTNFETLCRDESMEEINRFDPIKRGAVSHFYQVINNKDEVYTLGLKQKWAKELNMEIKDETWDECLKNIHKCSVNVRHILIQFKTLHRLNYSNKKMHSFFSDVSPLCNRCKSSIGNLTHSFWSCSKLSMYWKNIFCFLSGAFGKCWKPDPLVAILGAVSSLSFADKFEKKAVLFCMVVAKKLILRVWKMDSVPTFDL